VAAGVVSVATGAGSVTGSAGGGDGAGGGVVLDEGVVDAFVSGVGCDWIRYHPPTSSTARSARIAAIATAREGSPVAATAVAVREAGAAEDE
jgi:hypothetical protein